MFRLRTVTAITRLEMHGDFTSLPHGCRCVVPESDPPSLFRVDEANEESAASQTGAR